MFLLFSEGIQVSNNSDTAEFVFLANHQSTVQVYLLQVSSNTYSMTSDNAFEQ